MITPEPFWLTPPVPEMFLPIAVLAVRLKASVPLSVIPEVLPIVPVAELFPSCSVAPRPIVVAPE